MKRWNSMSNVYEEVLPRLWSGASTDTLQLHKNTLAQRTMRSTSVGNVQPINQLLDEGTLDHFEKDAHFEVELTTDGYYKIICTETGLYFQTPDREEIGGLAMQLAKPITRIRVHQYTPGGYVVVKQITPYMLGALLKRYIIVGYDEDRAMYYCIKKGE